MRPESHILSGRIFIGKNYGAEILSCHKYKKVIQLCNV